MERRRDLASPVHRQNTELLNIFELPSNWVKLPKHLDPRIAYLLPRMLNPNPKERISAEDAWNAFHTGIPDEEKKE